MDVTPLVTVNPATGREIASYVPMDHRAIGDTIDAARQAQQRWATAPLAERIERTIDVAAALEAHRDDLVQLIIDEVGKPRVEAIAEVDKCVATCRYFAGSADEMYGSLDVQGPGRSNTVRFEALGIILAIMPWNFPLWQVIRFAVPALLAGNAVVLKHAPNTTGTALALEALMREVGIPRGVFRALLITPAAVPDVVAKLIATPDIAAVTFTGSSATGAAVASAAGRSLKKSLLELGGSDPFVVLDDADVERAADAAVTSRFINCGQSCLAAKRFIVDWRVADEFIERFSTAVRRIVVGDPNDDRTQLGPMARDDLRSVLADQIARSRAAGAKVIVGGEQPAGAGWWFDPTVLVGVESDLDMAVMVEETFGPVAPVVIVDGDDAATALANRTAYGLGASVWSNDAERAASVGHRIRSGALFINAVVASDPRLPFGGVKQSGYGRELGELGAREFVNVRSVVSNLARIHS